MADCDLMGPFAGLNTLDSLLQSETKTMSFSDALNVDLFGTTLRRCRGQRTVLTLPAGILGLSQHEINGSFFMRAICSDGTYYRVEPLTATYTASSKTGLVGTKPYFFAFNDNLIALTGADDPFIDNGTTIAQTTFHTTYPSKYGTVGISFAGRCFIADGTMLAWSAANSMTGWDNTLFANDAGNKNDFIGTIIALQKFSNYLVIFTTENIYLMSGSDNASFAVQLYANVGIQSRNNVVRIDNTIYYWDGINGMYPLVYSGDLAEVNTGDPITYLVKNSINNIDTFRLDEIILIPYQNRKHIWAYVPIVNHTPLDFCWIINMENKVARNMITCYPRQANPITCACNLRGDIYSGTSTGKIYKEDNGNDFDGTPITNAYFWSNPFRFGTNRLKTIYDKMMLTFNSQSRNKCQFQIRYDATFYNPDQQSLDSLDIEDAYYVLNETEVEANQLGIVDDYVTVIVSIHDRWTIVQFGLAATEAGDDWILHGATFLDNRITNEYSLGT